MMDFQFPSYRYKTFRLRRQLDEEDLIRGKYSVLVRSNRVDDYIYGFTDYYPYKDVTLKVFLAEGDIETYVWGSDADRESSTSDLLTCTKIQNQLHYHGLSPRVIDLIYLESDTRRFVCQVTTEVKGSRHTDHKFVNWFFRTMRYLLNTLGIEVFMVDEQPGNLVGFQWVDFQGFRYKDEGELERKLLERVDKVCGWGPLNDAYQSVDCLGHKGRRPVNERISLLKLDDADFTDKTVLDIGCSAGLIADYAAARGAQYVVGVDMPRIAVAARDLANHLGIFNVNFFGYDVSDPSFGKRIYWESRQEKFDTVFYLAMFRHLGYPKHIDDLVGRVLYFEGHGGVDDEAEQFVTKFQEYFSKVELLGYSEDWGHRALLRCER